MVTTELRQGSLATLLAHIAQSVEHFLGKEEVTGSNPVVGSKDLRGAAADGLGRRMIRFFDYSLNL